eukprot:4715666-Amphidinium_carterae.2
MTSIIASYSPMAPQLVRCISTSHVCARGSEGKYRCPSDSKGLLHACMVSNRCCWHRGMLDLHLTQQNTAILVHINTNICLGVQSSEQKTCCAG